MVSVSPLRRTTGFLNSTIIRFTSSRWLPLSDSAAAPQFNGSPIQSFFGSTCPFPLQYPFECSIFHFKLLITQCKNRL
ncbi:hypothetical protein Ancab_039531 [Ancistrocladus abbreviatus]